MFQEVYNPFRKEYVFWGGCLQPHHQKVVFHVNWQTKEERDQKRVDFKEYKDNGGKKAICQQFMKKSKLNETSPIYQDFSKGIIPHSLNVHHKHPIKWGGHPTALWNLSVMDVNIHEAWHKYILGPIETRLTEIYEKNKRPECIVVLPQIPFYVNESTLLDVFTPSEQKGYAKLIQARIRIDSIKAELGDSVKIKSIKIPTISQSSVDSDKNEELCGMKETIICEQIMRLADRKGVNLTEKTLLKDIGITPEKSRQIVVNCSQKLEQQPVPKISELRPWTVGDIIFAFYSNAERYKYFEKMIVDGLNKAGNYTKTMIRPDEPVDKNIFCNEKEKDAVFKQIKFVTGRNYKIEFAEQIRKKTIKTAGDFIKFLSTLKNGVLSIERKGQAKMGVRMIRQQKQKGR